MSTIGLPASLIPTYSLAQCNRQGHAQFYIAAGDKGGLVPQAEFLTPHRKDYMQAHIQQADTIYFTAPHQVRLVEQAPRRAALLWGSRPSF